MNSNTVNSIISYINIVCADAAKAAGRDNDVQWQFCIIKNNVIFSMKSKYIKVRSRILYRLTKNFNRKFHGFYFKFVPACTYDMRMQFDDMFDDTRGFRTYDLKEGIDPNYSFTEWDLFGTPVTIQSFRDNELISPDAGKPGVKVVNKHYENFIDLTGDFSYGVNTHDWGKYSKDYEAIYGMKPYSIDKTYKNY